MARRWSRTLLPLLAGLAAPAAAQTQVADAATDVVRCQKPLGSISVVEPRGTNWWTGNQLSSPASLIKLFVNRSGCFTLVDRGAGLAAAERERSLASRGELRSQSNIGKGQMKSADYVLVPDIVTKNNNSGGNSFGGVLGRLIGGRAGAVLGGIDLKRKTADVLLTVTDVRSSEQVAMAQGSAQKTDLRWRGGGIGGVPGGVLGAAAGGYSNTELGQVVGMAYIQAYNQLVGQLGGLPANASAANVAQAVTVAKPARLLADPAGKGAVVRDLDVGMMLYPTGNKQGGMWEVEDELGHKGWVSSTLLRLSR
jgi:curli biogenesis system outer membrane secretion channel CsgG